MPLLLKSRVPGSVKVGKMGAVLDWPRVSLVGQSFTDKKEWREMGKLAFLFVTSFIVVLVVFGEK